MQRAVQQVAPDLVDVQGLWTHRSIVNLRWNRRSGTPYLVTPRGMLDPWALRRSNWKKKLAGGWFENDHLIRAACLRATATQEARYFRDYGLRGPIAIVPNGVDVPQFVPRATAQARPRRLLFLSRIHPKKGLDFLLRAWSVVASQHRDWELVIAGPDELGYRAEMQKAAETLGLRSIVWLDGVFGDAKSALYRSADLFVLPTHAENFGLVVAEALAHEVPVITTTNAPWQGLEQHRCGWWIDLDDRSLVKALDEAMSLADADRHAMGASGRAWVEQDFAWATVARQMHEVYTWVLGGGEPPGCVMID